MLEHKIQELGHQADELHELKEKLTHHEKSSFDKDFEI